MSALRLEELKPRRCVSEKTAPAPLRKALTHIFSACPEGLWLVGGTAIAGYYAEHRRSDDLDLFAVDETAFRTTVLAVKSLEKIGATLTHERRSPTYYHTDTKLENHCFTIDVVLDENLHRIGKAERTDDGVRVAGLPTLFAMKISTLVSRCSEKDLFDLDWIYSQTDAIDPGELIEKGLLFDGGISVETLLISLKGTNLRQEACHFLLPGSSLTVAQVYRNITALRDRLIRKLLDYEKSLPPSEEVKTLSRSVRKRRS